MSGLLGDPSQLDDPSAFSLLTADMSPDSTVTPAPSTPAPSMADTGGGSSWLDSLRSTLGDVGVALGGGIDPSITGEQRTQAGQRALLNFGLNMLAASGPSYTPRNFGQVLAAGLSGAQTADQYSTDLRYKSAQLAMQQQLKLAQLQIAGYLAKARGGKAFDETTSKQAVRDLAASGGGGTGNPAAAPAATPAAASPQDFVQGNLPLFATVAQQTGMPLELVAGQAGNESAWGTSPAAVQGNNLFGLSDESGKPLSFPTKQAGADAYVNLLKGRYANVPRTGTPTDIATALGAAGYNKAVPDYGKRIGASAAQAQPFLPQPTTTGPTGTPAPGSMAQPPAAPAGPGADAVGPATPPSTPQSPAATVFGPGMPGWQTLDPALIAAKKANIEDQYQRELAAGRASGSDTVLASAAKNRSDALNALAGEETALNQKLFEQRQTIAADKAKSDAQIEAENKRAADTITADKARNDATLANQVAIEKIKGGQDFHKQIQEQSAVYAQDNTIKPMAGQAIRAHEINMGLAQIQPLLASLPPGGGALGTVLNAHPDLAPLFATAGILDKPQANAVQLINGLAADITAKMKPQGLGALREYEWNAFKSQLPTLLETPDGQQKAISMMMNLNNRVQSESAWMNNYFSRAVPDPTSDKPGATIPAHNLDTTGGQTVQQLMDAELGPLVPRYKGSGGGGGQAQWEQTLPPGQPYYKTLARPDPKNPGQPLRDANGRVQTYTSLEFRPW